MLSKVYIFRMPRTGKSDACWDATLWRDDRGKFCFKIGQKPGKEKWRKVVQEIESCPKQDDPAEPDTSHNQTICSCGYHEITLLM